MRQRFASLLITFFFPAILSAADTVSASKDCIPTPCTAVVGGLISIGPLGQNVSWSASYSGMPPQGDKFYLSTGPGGNTDDVLVKDHLLSNDGGTFFLSAGNYSIAVRTAFMGPGSYSITFNQTASVSCLPPLSHPFGSLVAGSAATVPHTFTIHSSGDLPVSIGSITSSDAHFEITSPPTGQQVPPNRTFGVRFNPGPTPGGPFTGIITISGTSVPPGTSVASTTVTVTGTTLPNVPNITCSGASCGSAVNLGSADGDIGEVRTFTLSFRNMGTAPLNITSIALVNDSPGSPFSIVPPSTAPVPPGGTRNVQVTFAPAPGEALYCGNLVIQSNDPDEPVKNCFFSARGHHPVPHMVIASDTIDYREVELVFSYHRAIQVTNTGDAPLHINVTHLCDTDPTCNADLPNFAPHALGGPFTVAPNGGEQLIEQIFTPQSAGTHTIRIRVAGDDATNPSRNVTLTGVGRLPIPIDSVLVVDRSGSMDESAGPRRKIDALRTAADLFVHLLRIGPDAASSDAVGIVKYNASSSVYLPFGTMDAAHIAAAEGALDAASVTDTTRLGPDGHTGIGGGMQSGAALLVPPNDTRKHVMIVLTDGVEDRDPRVATVLGPVHTNDPGLKIYSVGLGSDIAPDILQQITNVTNGRFLATSDLTGIHRYELETFYFKIFSNATGMSIVVDPTTPVTVAGSDPIIIGTATLVSSDRYATFLVLDEPELRDFYKLELIDPLGHTIDVGSSVAGVAVHISRRNNYSLYRVEFPNISSSPQYAGEWTLRLSPNGKWSPERTRQLNTKDVINPFAGIVPVGFGVAVGSDYKMTTSATSSTTLPGALVELTASFTDRGWPSAGKSVTVDATAPDRTETNGIVLFDDGTHGDAVANDSTWTARFASTATAGVYQFLFRGIGQNERGELVPREESRWIPLVEPTKPKGPDCGNPADPGSGNDGHGGKSRVVWLSLHLGDNFPLGSMRKSVDSGLSLTVDAEVTLTNALSAYVMVGNHFFDEKPGGANLEIVNLSLNLRRYFGGGTWPLFVQIGPGLYRASGSSTDPGANLGIGWLFPLHPKFGVEIGANLHSIFNGGGRRTFVDATLGVRFRH